MNPQIFREYDIRGIAEQDLTDDVALNVGRAFGTVLRRGGGTKVVLGHDIRLSSPRLHARIARGLALSGLDVFDVGSMPTPVVYFAEVHLGTDGSLQVTGSHNPAEYNGFKMTVGGASTYGRQIQELKDLIETEDFESGDGEIRTVSVIDEYMEAVTGRISLQSPPHIVIDAGNGMAGPAAVRIFGDLGCSVDELYCEPDGRFPNHLPDPTVPQLMEDLQKAVVSGGADLGIGFDGDGDRIGVVDAGGRLIFGDQLLAIYARDVLERMGKQKVLFDVKCSQGLVEDIEAHGGQPVMWKTGHSLIKAEMKRSKVPIAGEMSGHMFFGEGWFGFDDAIYAAARLLGILDRWNLPLADVVDDIPYFHSTPELRVECADSEKFDVVNEVTELFKQRSDVDVIDIDGARVIFEGGWGLARASNTQPVIVLRFEGRTVEILQMVRREFMAVLEGFEAIDLESLD
jgi:phosphomannomutase/phosphoglucomutase